MKVLCVDGPLRGQIRTLTKGGHFLYQEMPLLTAPGRTLTYHVHSYVLINRMIKLASLCLLAEEISTEDVWEAIASDKAKDAVALSVPDDKPGYHGEGELADFDPATGRSSWDDWS